MMLRILFALFLVLIWFVCQHGNRVVATSPHPSLPSPGMIDGLGVNIHFTDARPGELEMLADAGFRWVRMDLTWARTERERGQYDFTAYDRLLDNLEKHAIRALLILDYSNMLYEQERSVATEQGRSAYARWVAAAVNHFKGRGVIWEIWNEPNIQGFWRPKPNVDHYTAMAIAACRAMSEVAPKEAIIGPATSQIDLEFLERCFEAGLLEHWDAVSVHPYRQQAPETVITEYRKLQRLIAKYAPQDKDIPILSAEWGYSSAWHNYDVIEQGKLLPRQWLTNMAAGVPISIWYDWHDDGDDPTEAEHNFGTVAFNYHSNRNPVYDAKPAYLAASTLTSALNGFQFIKRIRVGSPNDFALLFGKADSLKVAVWTTDDEPRKITLPSDNNSVFQVITYTGEQEANRRAKNHTLEIMIDDAPRYLEVESTNAALRSAPEAIPMHAKMEPILDQTITIRVENSSGKAFRGTAELTPLEGVNLIERTLPLSFDPQQIETTLLFPLAVKPKSTYQAGIRIMNSTGQTIMTMPPQRFLPLPVGTFDDARVVEDGDREVSCVHSKTNSPAPDPLPGFHGDITQLVYQFGNGWKFLRLATDPRPSVDGIPKALGLWIYGDGRLGSPRIRILDANGEIWQPSGPTISWTGWKYIEIPINDSVGSWGGDANRRLDPPLQWDTLFLLDNPSRKEVEGEIYLAAPHLIY